MSTTLSPEQLERRRSTLAFLRTLEPKQQELFICKSLVAAFTGGKPKKQLSEKVVKALEKASGPFTLESVEVLLARHPLAESKNLS